MKKMQKTVKEDRNLYVGGSDIPIIMGISPFKTRWQLLQEKAELIEDDFEGNKYTEYGNIMEQKIRDYINQKEKEPFVENQTIKGNKRYHSDGSNSTSVLEIKTTSQIYEDIKEYKQYLVQLLYGMEVEEKEEGKLAVYHRLEDEEGFNTEFYEELLQLFEVNKKDYTDLLEEIDGAVGKFVEDLEKLKENPELTEEDLQPLELIEISNQVVALEYELTKFKKIEAKHKELKEKLYEEMSKRNVKKWETNNGTKITLTPSTTVEKEEIDMDKLFKEEPKIFEKYKIVKTIDRKGYVRITLPKVS